MLLCLDTGNSSIHSGVYAGDELRAQFRKSTHPAASADELGVFFNAVLRANGVEPAEIHAVAICSVVPAALHALRAAAVKYFNCEPFVLQAGVKTGLRVRYRNPHEVGADRIASAIAAVHLHPRRNLIVVDFGTATTIEAITADADYLGGAILPGVGISADTLANHTAKLPRVEIMRPPTVLGRTTAESIQSGLFYGHAGAVARLVKELIRENFGDERPHVLGTGGFARMFEGEQLFDELVPELVLTGLREAVRLNSEPA